MSTKATHLLVIEDDPNLGYLLREYLQMNDFKVTLVTTVAQALKAVEHNYFDLAVLDVMLPDGNGFDLAKAMATHHPALPFLFLTARSLKVDVLKGFALGAVDYLKKPIDEEELVVRIRSLVTRLGSNKGTPSNTKAAKLMRIGAYTFNPGLQELHRDGQIHSLSKRESDLLALLATHANELVTHKDILVPLWGKNDYFNKKSLNVFISHLRKYLQDDPSVQIDNVHNKGFVLRVG
ncbi:response regulator transcription factor [Flavobacteriaceae bacterium]|nr:response regulator transcription factor [Flavobacteriaceae bacterium]